MDGIRFAISEPSCDLQEEVQLAEPKSQAQKSCPLTNKPALSIACSEELVAAIVSRQPLAEDEFCRRYLSRVKRYAKHLERDQHKAEDLVQDVMMLVINKIRRNELTSRQHLPAFIDSTTYYCFIGHFRETRRRSALLKQFWDSTPLPEQPIESNVEILTKQRFRQSIQEMLSRVGNTRDRELLRQHYLMGIPKIAICENLALTPVHFDRVAHRAKKRLLKSITSEMISYLNQC